jgi:hypothetical protein
MLITGEHARPHVPWIAGCVIAAAGALVWFLVESVGQSAWPSGGSRVGLALGVAAGLICLFEFLLWPRKKLRTWRIGPVQWWLRAHIWLGLLVVPLAVLHSGFRLGGPLSAATMLVLVIVIVSGVWGLAMQQFLPSRMLDLVPAETIVSQIPHLSGLAARDGARLVAAVCGDQSTDDDEDGDLATHLVVGAVRQVGALQGRVLLTAAAPSEPVPESESLRAFFDGSARPYLLSGKAGCPGLAGERAARAWFLEVRAGLPPAAHPAVAALEDLCSQRRQWDRQAWLHGWLHAWLLAHLPLSVLLMGLLAAHVVWALMYTTHPIPFIH